MAFAASATWTDVQDFAPDIFLSKTNPSFSFTHNIKQEGFVPLQDVVSTYDLKISFHDDGDKATEMAFIDLPGLLADQIIRVYTDATLGISIAALLQLNTTGTLDVTVWCLKGDFYLDKSVLSAHGLSTTPVQLPATVPEPAISFMLLIGLGSVAAINLIIKKDK